jgi:dihydrofolate reductase
MNTAESSASSVLATHHFRAIAAVAENGVIGANNRIPWHIPEELEFFRSATSGSTVVFGRKTFESIGRILPHRKNIIFSRSAAGINGGTVAHSVGELLDLTNDAWICGGGEIYGLLLPACRELYISTVRGCYRGDAVFPEYESMFGNGEVLLDAERFYVTRFVNKNYHALAEEN